MIPNVHLIKMCIKQLFFGGVVAEVGVISITVIVVGIIVVIRNVPNFTAQCKFSTHDCGFTSKGQESGSVFSVAV